MSRLAPSSRLLALATSSLGLFACALHPAGDGVGDSDPGFLDGAAGGAPGSVPPENASGGAASGGLSGSGGAPQAPAVVSISDVTLRTTVNPFYLGADNNGGGPVWANATVAQDWETFTLLDLNGGALESGDSVRLQAGNGSYFAVNGTTLAVTGTAEDASAVFVIQRVSGAGVIVSGDTVGLQSSGGTWLSAANGGGTTVNAAGATLSTWESFVLGLGASTPLPDPEDPEDPVDPDPVDPDPPVVPNAPRAPGLTTLANGRGAHARYAEYEAEDMSTNGTQLGPTRTFGQVAAEASGRRAVRLDQTGKYVEFTNAYAANSIVVRYSVPDGGADSWTTLSVFVNGEFRTKLSTTSRYSWTYGGDADFNKTWQNDPGIGNPHHFFDETRALIGDVPVGAQVQIKKDSGDNAGRYDVDLVDMEQVDGALGKPSNFLSLVSDCGGTANDDSDDSNALQYCVDRARNEGKGVYIPAGRFNSYSKTISVAGVTLRGAGLWHTTINGYFARFDCWGGNCRYYDFSVLGDTTRRIDDSPETAFSGNGSSGSWLENIWVEHVKVGYWTGAGTNNLTIKNSRFRNLFADGVNFYGGTSNSTVDGCHFRNTGDDALAGWAQAGNGRVANAGNVFSKNYVQLPWKANCFALYGGGNNIIEDNVCADVVQYPGILIGRQFDAHAFFGSTQIRRNTLIRAGGWAYNQEQGAIKLHAQQGPVEFVTVTQLEILSPTYYGVHVQGQSSIGSVWFDGVTIDRPGNGAFFLNWGAQGAMNADNVVVTNSPQGVRNDTGGAFNLLRGGGNSGW